MRPHAASRARAHPRPSLSYSSSQEEPESKAKAPQQEEGPKGRRWLGGPGRWGRCFPALAHTLPLPGVDEQSDSSEESEEEKPPEEEKEEEEEKKAPTPQEKKRRKGAAHVAPILEARVGPWRPAASSPLPCRLPSSAVEISVGTGSRGCSGPDPFPVPRRQQRGVGQLRGERH